MQVSGPGEHRPRRGSGQLESEILALLWTADGPMTAGAVQRTLDADLAYTTVVTILSRLHDKQVLRRARNGRAYAYEPVTDEPGIAARSMRNVLDSENDRHGVLAQFVSDLSNHDEQLLRNLLGHTTRPGR